MILADARQLPFKDASFDMVFGSPPWDHFELVEEARPEITRVLSKRGMTVLVLPNLDNPQLATLFVANRDWTERQTFTCEKPSGRDGPRYFSMADSFAERVLRKYRPRRVLDPFCGTGTIPRVAQSLGMFALGCDIDRACALVNPVSPHGNRTRVRLHWD